ncbi:MAG TPA: nitrous oxide reductase accessory protein NosL [Chitinophagaceae bacterium]|nr:nitrous oxide reductase accessory protein NosL [Chitinophagaceae bacterium]
MKKNTLKGWVRLLLALAGLALLPVIFIPIWRIELSAPQYPEGLVLLINAGKLGGNVDIINGLNHYIGMKTLHSADFAEFTVLPYLVGFFAALFPLGAIVNKKSFLYVLFFAFVAFGIIAMVDFWRWEYNYGHNLNPDAAIVVPGMAYQPPLIGFKQLLNFGAYSIPDAGGWIFIGAGVVLFVTVVYEFKTGRRLRAGKNILHQSVAVCLIAVMFYSCSSAPQRIVIGEDNCTYCNMTFSDARFGGEIVTQKGKVYEFDDIACLLSFLKQQPGIAQQSKNIYVVDFAGNHALMPVASAILFSSENLHTPMNGNIAAFADKESFEKYSGAFKGNLVSWNELINK